ncbi:MAG: 16S rRNA (guanine(966)-N(2))-methyltransferase RsmD [Methylococcales bacterium]|jgi:16S rRNA (guanine966-N2)-methyltransferase|nr:16S rRNA (guanine(966)-N(2))-methyltransferase RsmD [Methylococcales bacterium]
MVKNRNQVNIIGGEYRGRLLSVSNVDGLRPTTNRIRETVFNWLQPMIVGSTCLDLFAGSGALGIEAVSRGAKYADLIDVSRVAVKNLKQNLDKLKISNVELFNESAFNWIKNNKKTYDIIFLDPPFELNCLDEISHLLCVNKCLKENTIIYMEYNHARHLSQIPDGWSLLKNKKTGQVAYSLYDVKQNY